MDVFKGFDVRGVPEDGFDSEEYWFIRKSSDWVLSDDGSWLDIGGPGVDGICWALVRGRRGVFAYYPMEETFLWKAEDVPALIRGWVAGEIFV